MFTRILVPLDGSAQAERALVPAIALAMREDGELVLVNVVSNPWVAGMGVYLEDLVRRLTAEGVRARIALPLAAPAEGIRQEAERAHAELIVMSPHAHTGLEVLWPPSVTWEVLQQTSAPILVWRGAEADQLTPVVHLPRFMTEASAPLVVPLDGSLAAERGLALARPLAHTFGHPLVLVRAVERKRLGGEREVEKAALQSALEEAEAYLHEKQEALSQEGLLVTCVAGLAPAAELIQAIARQEEAGLVVMASHGRGWLGQLVFGSVTRRVLSQGDTPVLLVRQMMEEEGAPAETTPAQALT